MTAESSFPTSVSSLLLPSASQSFSGTLSSLKRSTLCIANRLQSIHHDSLFVQSVASNHSLPLVANERCGSWYLPPGQKAGSAYFKSTDGHWGQWSFSTRRLNLQILDIIGKSGGFVTYVTPLHISRPARMLAYTPYRCIIVDSTRRGKSMPDALSKSIPIWCAVINRLVFPEMHESHILNTPKDTVGASEHSHIEALLYGFVQDAKDLRLDIYSLRSRLKKPLQPCWVTPDSTSTYKCTPTTVEYHTIICCTASRRVFGAERMENGYIQGAGDDSEGWSKGLTPTVFWNHSEQLLAAVEMEMPDLIRSLTAMDREHGPASDDAVKIGPTRLYIGTLSSSAQTKLYDGLVICSNAAPPQPDQEDSSDEGMRVLNLSCGDGKLGSRDLRSQLPLIPPFIASLPDRGLAPKILVLCSTGRDLSVGLALATLCLFFDDSYNFNYHAAHTSIDKSLIRRRLATITSAKPDANPSRSTLQSVHAFLMPRRD